MKRLTAISSALISICMLLALSCSTANQAGQPLNLEKYSRYRVSINTSKGNFTGIMLLKQTGNEWRGSLVNEFGIKAFDMETIAGKCKLRNTMPMLNKWYIRKTIESDLNFLFTKANRGLASRTKKTELLPDNSFKLINTGRRIEYNFQPISQ